MTWLLPTVADIPSAGEVRSVGRFDRRAYDRAYYHAKRKARRKQRYTPEQKSAQARPARGGVRGEQRRGALHPEGALVVVDHPCQHCWPAAYLPMEMGVAGKLLKGLHCPMCGVGPKRILIAKQVNGVLKEPANA